MTGKVLSKVFNHQEVKPKLLNLIKQIKNLHKGKDQQITNTDYWLPKDVNKPYMKLFQETVTPTMVGLCKNWHCERWEIQNAWFQQYSKGDFHGWHNHGRCQFANVYFLDLPDNKMTTQFYKEEPVEVEEGTILTFPSWLIHSSPINTSDKIKTVIAFNSSFLK
jgi:hypothetical protein